MNSEPLFLWLINIINPDQLVILDYNGSIEIDTIKIETSRYAHTSK